MKLIIAGLGPGNPELMTLEAVKAASDADVIIIPRSSSQSRAENILGDLLLGRQYFTLAFPMIYDAQKRDEQILSELEDLRPHWQNAESIFFPVIGDSMLYSTGKYLLDAWRKLVPALEVSFIPGISAHSLAASAAKRFLAMKDEIFSIIPCTASPERIRSALLMSGSAALYKPSALKEARELLDGFNVIRVDYAGIAELERVITGTGALEDLTDYMSVLLVWRGF